MDFEKSSSVYHCFLLHHVCLPNLKHVPSRKLPLAARKTVFSHLKTKSFILLSCWRKETRVYIDSFPFAYRITTVELPSSSHLACSQTLYFLFKFRQAQVIKYKLQGSYWLPAQGGKILSELISDHWCHSHFFACVVFKLLNKGGFYFSRETLSKNKGQIVMSKQKKIELESNAAIMVLQILIFHESSKISPYGKTISKWRL